MPFPAKPRWFLALAMALIGALSADRALGADDWRDVFGRDMIEAPKPVDVPGLGQPAGAGNNTCQYAFDGVCDEPSNCAAGTDSRDCTVGFGR
jgi:hypothetical protein